MGENPELRFDEPEEERQVDIPEVITPGTPPSEQTGQAAPELPENIGIPDVDIPKIDPYVEFQRIAEVARTEAVGFDGPRKWKGDHWGRYDVDDWLRGWARMSQVVADSGAQRLMVEATYKPNGLPSEWDYRNPPDNRGPWGEPLPEGAIGWDPRGEPDYGPGPINWFKKQFAAIADIKSTADLIADVPEQYIGENYTTVRDQLWDDKDAMGWLKHTVGAGVALLSYRIQERATENPSPVVSYVAGFAQKIVLEGVFEIFNQAAVAIERFLGPALLSSADIIDREVAKGTISWYEVIDKIPVVREASRILLGHIVSAGTGGGISDIAALHRDYRAMEQSDWNIMGSRISYSLATDQMLREDYKRRIAEGEDPRLLAMDLELPGVELGTRVFLDPLNYLAPLGAASKSRKLEAAGRLMQATPIDDLVKVTDEIADIATAASAKGLATRIEATTESVRLAMRKVRAGVLDLGTKRGVRVLTSRGKRAITGRRIGDHLNVMYSHYAGDTEGFFTYVNGMVLVASDDAVDVAKGLTLITKEAKAPLNMAFSQGGTEMAVFMREILYDASTGKLNSLESLLSGLDEAAGVAEFMEIVGRKLDGALGNIFPTIHEQIQLNDELAEVIERFGKKSDEVVEFLAKNPQAEHVITPSQRLMAKADLNMQKYFYSPAVKAQSFVYMRMNPVYAMRNRWTNAFHVLVDEGPTAAYKSFFSPDKALAEIDNLLGFVPSSATRGIGPRGGVRGLEESFEAGDFWNWSKKSQKYEQAASAQIYAKSIRDSMRKGMQEGVAIPGRSFLTGFTDEEGDLLIALAKRHNGDKAKILADIRKLGGDEGLNAAKNLLFLEDDAVKTLKDLRLYDDGIAIGLQAESLDEVDELIDALKAGYADEASRAASEAALLGEPADHIEAAEVADNLALEQGLNEAGGAGDETADLMARQILADRAMLKEQELILADMEQDLLLTFRSQLEVDIAEGTLSATQANNQAKQMVDDLVSPIRAETTRITDKAVQEADNLRNSKLIADKKSFGIGRTPRGPERDARFAAIWGETGLPAKPAEFFTDMTPKKFRRLGWEEYFPTRNSVWVTRRDQVFLQNNVLMHEAGAFLGRTEVEMGELLGRTYRKAANARMFQHAELMEDGTAVLRMTGSEMRGALLDAHADVVRQAQAAKTTAGAIGVQEVTTEKFGSLLESLTKRPDMSIDAAYGYLGDDGQKALAAIAGTGTGDAADIARQQEALSIIIGKEPYTITKMGTSPSAVSMIEGPNIMEFRVARDMDTGLPIIEQIGAVTPGQGTGEDALKFYLRDAVEKGETEFLTTYQLEDVLGVKKGSGIVPDLTTEHLDEPVSVLIQDVMEGKAEYGLYEAGAADIGKRPGKGSAIHEGDVLTKGYTSNRQWVVDARKNFSDDEIIYVLEKIRAGEDIPKYVAGTGKGVARKIVEEGTEGATNRSRALTNLHDELLAEVRTIAVEGRPALTREVTTGGRTFQRTVAEDVPPSYTTPGGVGFFEKMEEKGYITYLEDVPQPDKIMPDGSTLKIEDIKKYKINAENIKPAAGSDVFTHRLTAPDDGFLYSPARNAYETQSAAYKAIEDLRTGLHENWGDLRQATISPEMERSSQEWLGEMGNRVTEMKATAVEVANKTRDFALLDYEARTGLDNMLSYIYPYQFWYKGTYRNWLTRVRYNPALASRYGHYRNWLEGKHAGMPDWWKYNINIQEDLLGIETDHPLFFNLEATLNPLNGMTGVDFNDPRRRLDWWSATADDLGKFGPTIWTPYSLAIATRYHLQGEDEAAGRWAGRVSPLTRTFRDATALMGLGEGKGIEVDPFLHLFSGGIDPYEQARIGKQFSAMTDEGKYPEAALIDAAYTQKGPLWDEAHTKAIHQRAPNVLAILTPFFLGAGFKPRTESDIEIDRMYAEMYGHMGSKSEQSPEDYQEGWDKLRQKYPFMDAVLMSRKSGDERDEALAWNVLDRIPPGMTDEIADLVDIKGHDITKFYDSKGDLSSMSDPDRMRFMAAVMDIGALLEMPDAPTKAEWNDASNAYKSLLAEGETLFGDDIWDKVDVFYGKPQEERSDHLRNNPIVEQALDWKQSKVISSPIMAPYYTSIDRIEGYMKGMMYDVIEDELGDDIWDKWEVYHRLKDMNSADARKYWKATPELKRFGEIKDEMEPRIGTALVGIAGMLPTAKPPNWRGAAPEDGFDATNTETEAWIRSEVLAYSSGRETTEPVAAAPNLDFLRQLIQMKGGVSLNNLITDYVLLGEVMPLAAQGMLDDIADDLGIDGEDILALMSEYSQ